MWLPKQTKRMIAVQMKSVFIRGMLSSFFLFREEQWYLKSRELWGEVIIVEGFPVRDMPMYPE